MLHVYFGGTQSLCGLGFRRPPRWILTIPIGCGGGRGSPPLFFPATYFVWVGLNQRKVGPRHFYRETFVPGRFITTTGLLV